MVNFDDVDEPQHFPFRKLLDSLDVEIETQLTDPDVLGGTRSTGEWVNSRAVNGRRY